MRLSHSHPVWSAFCDDPNLLGAAGVVPVMALAEQAGLSRLSGEYLTVPTDKGANPDRKMFSLVAGMAAGADSIDDMAVLRHGAMGRVFDHPYAPSTLGSFLRESSLGMSANSTRSPFGCWPDCTPALRYWPGSTAR